MDFGAVHDPNRADSAAQLEGLGYAYLGSGDSLSTFTQLARLARETRVAEFGSFIMTSYGRHPAVTASETTTIQRASGGRLTMTIGRGFRSAALMGRPPISLTETKAYIQALRGLLRGESVAWDGDSIPALAELLPVPVFLSAYGPFVRRTAGEAADGVVLAAGSSIPMLESFLGEVADGARAAGRSPEEVTPWLLARASVRPDRADALDDIRGLLAASAYRHLRAPSQLETVPTEYRARLAEFRRRYDPEGFEGYQPSWDGPNARLVHELDLDDYLASRFAIVGTPDECRAQVSAIAATGVRRIVFAPGARDSDTLYQRIADALIRDRGDGGSAAPSGEAP